MEAHDLRSKAKLLGFLLGTRRARADEVEFGKSSDDIVVFLGLQAIRHELASNLPQGHLRALGMAIGLATQPEVLRPDAPSAGRDPGEQLQRGASGGRGAHSRWLRRCRLSGALRRGRWRGVCGCRGDRAGNASR